uniref:Uncharacterized protein n=1 Tax=Ixodes ricinus TaxID=34613 RepID=A0A6B0UME4_IXORI
MAMISTSGLRLILGRVRAAPPAFRRPSFLEPRSRTELPLRVSSTTSTTLSVCWTPTMLSPLRYSTFGVACDTQPAATTFFPCRSPASMAPLKWSSAGFFTVQLLSNHRSALDASSTME